MRRRAYIATVLSSTAGCAGVLPGSSGGDPDGGVSGKGVKITDISYRFSPRSTSLLSVDVSLETTREGPLMLRVADGRGKALDESTIPERSLRDGKGRTAVKIGFTNPGDKLRIRVVTEAEGSGDTKLVAEKRVTVPPRELELRNPVLRMTGEGVMEGFYVSKLAFEIANTGGIPIVVTFIQLNIGDLRQSIRTQPFEIHVSPESTEQFEKEFQPSGRTVPEVPAEGSIRLVTQTEFSLKRTVEIKSWA